MLSCIISTTRLHISLLGENELLQTEIRRLELAIQSTENPLHIARDCLSNRQRRVDTDLVQDDAENNLLKVRGRAEKQHKSGENAILTAFPQEMETISQVRETLTRSLENAKEQLKASREAKHQEHEAYAKIASVFLSYVHAIIFGLKVASIRPPHPLGQRQLGSGNMQPLAPILLDLTDLWYMTCTQT